ncbi:MAG: bifunctional diaminohydroxyphosphoribosylaminopyrimidine deaminase/5-amino-6-(5-phosphoribosylamino)uracil reductase RibD [Flavobacteriales bacterium]
MNDMNADDRWMRRCLQLARNGAGHVAPNPMVGSVLVQREGILAEGWHRLHGGPHAEVECLRAFGDGPIPDDATLFVNLEPCAHHGLTPPCIDLVIARELKSLVIGCADPNPLTREKKGIARAREAGVHLRVDILQDECRWLNRRFITSFEKQRPYVILKWAQSADGFLDQRPRSSRSVQRITTPTTDALVHAWRAEEQAILVGSRTALNDDPMLNVRHVEGRSPLRVLIDRTGLAPMRSHLFVDGGRTLLVTAAPRQDVECDQLIIEPGADPIGALLAELHRRAIRSLLVEGGAGLLGHFIRGEVWDEARVITGTAMFGHGTIAPVLGGDPFHRVTSGADRIAFHLRQPTPAATWTQ